jgi:hypothetical protein
MNTICAVCGQEHGELPDIGADRPVQWWLLDEQEQERARLTEDTCIINDEDFFVRGVIEIPLLDDSERFGFGAWVSLKRDNFFLYLDNFDSAEIGPFFGWLCTEISYYEEDTVFLKTSVRFRGGGLRPTIQLEPGDHLLALQQANGITSSQAWEIVHFYLQKS